MPLTLALATEDLDESRKLEKRDGQVGERFQMIIREWRGRATLSKAEVYPAHFRTNVLPELLHVPGFLGAQLSSRQLDNGIEFLVLTRWQSIDSIQGFAGSDISKAVVEPGAVAALFDFDTSVQHYEVIEEVQSSGASAR